MLVKKRDSKIVNFNEESIRLRLYHIDPSFDPDFVIKTFIKNIYDSKKIINTYEIDNEICTILNTNFNQNKKNMEMLDKLYISNFLLRMGDISFKTFYNNNKHKLMSEFYDFIEENIEILNNLVLNADHYIFKYLGFKVLEENYLMRDVENNIVETPMIMFMRVAIFSSNKDLSFLQKIYNSLINFDIILGTPVLYNALIKNQNQIASCYLQSIYDSSLENIMDHIKTSSLIASSSGGIGINISNVTMNYSMDQIIPFFNDIRQNIKQNGKRNGNIALYLDIWCKGIEQFIYKKSVHHDNSYKDLFFGIMINDLFMERVLKNEDWSLFNPKDVPLLYSKDSYGKVFTSRYLEYENDKNIERTKINSFNLYNMINNAKLISGNPYCIYSDTVNEMSNENHMGIIRCSNLCTEIMQYSSDDHLAVCILGSLGVNKMYTYKENKKVVDYEKIKYNVTLLTILLNNILDINQFSTSMKNKNSKESRNNKNHEAFESRNIGIGIRGLGDLFLNLNLSFDSQDSKDINKKIFEYIYYYSLQTSSQLSLKNGESKNYKNSLISKNKLHIDHYDNVFTSLDWKTLREEIKENGLRNNLLTALMPTSSTSQITHTTESFEPIELLYTKQLISGNFVYVHPVLFDIIPSEEWKEVMQLILENRGSIQNIDKPYFTEDIKLKLRTVYEISQFNTLQMAIDRSPYIDQSQSFNLYIKDHNLQTLLLLGIKAWEGKMKTGNYYVRTPPAFEPIQYTTNNKVKKNNIKNEDNNKDVCSMGCESCSA